MTIQEILNDAGVDFLESGNHHCRYGWIQTRLCPYCASNNYHLGFNLSGKFFFCWRCRWHPTVSTLIKLGVNPNVARASFRELEVEDAPAKEKLGKLVEPLGRGPLLSAHRKYLIGRQFNPDELEKIWSLQGIGIAPELSWRIYIPIFCKGIKVSWTTRAIGDRVTQRYLSAPLAQAAKNLKHLVFGLDFCAHKIVVVEGPTDAFAVGPGAGALFGTAFTTLQLRILADVPYRYICFDSSEKAQARARDLACQLAPFPGETHNVILDAEDPGSASKRELARLRRITGI